jgi:alpha/beta superfamily hydrolase
MGERVVIPGPRDVRGTFDGDGEACVVAAPPHPNYGGHRSDPRLRAVSDAITEREIACLRVGFGPWDEGHGERDDVANALAWARERCDGVGLFGYSFGATVGLLAAQEAEPDAVSALAPQAIASDAVLGLTCPVQVVYGERDDTVDWAPVVARARERGHLVSGVDDDHWFGRERKRVTEFVGAFFDRMLTRAY